MKKVKLLSVVVICFLLFQSVAEAAWIWSPSTGKWLNPKKSAKDTPEDQLEWAMGFYDKKDWGRAIEEFEKIPRVFPNSRLAAEGVYYSGICWEQKGDFEKAANQYQKLIDSYPYSDRIKDAAKREFELANAFASGKKLKVLGMPLLTGQEKAIELYKHIIKSTPFGTYGDQAQFQIGEVYKAQGEYEEAQKAFQTVVDEYPTSELVGKARYQIAYCSMLASKKSEYNEQYTERAIDEFQGFKKTFPNDQQVVEADEAIRSLRAKKASASFETAQFYERQGKYRSAKIYYQQVAQDYADTPYGPQAKKKMNEMLKLEVGQLEDKPAGKPWYQALNPLARSAAPTTSLEDKKKVDQTPQSQVNEPEAKPAEQPAEHSSFNPLAGLGYTTKSLLPADIKTIAIQPVKNTIDISSEISDKNRFRVYRPGVEVDVTNAIINRFIFDGNLKVVSSERADAVIEAKMTDYSRDPLRYTDGDEVQEYRLSIRLDVVVYQSRDHKILWHDQNLVGDTTFFLSGAHALTEDEALVKVVDDVARRVVERTIELW